MNVTRVTVVPQNLKRSQGDVMRFMLKASENLYDVDKFSKGKESVYEILPKKNKF